MSKASEIADRLEALRGNMTDLCSYPECNDAACAEFRAIIADLRALEDATRLPEPSSYNTAKSAIYVEYYSHESADCYKIDMPFTKYRKDTLVLCLVSEGIEVAKERAVRALLQRIADALAQRLKEDADGKATRD